MSTSVIFKPEAVGAREEEYLSRLLQQCEGTSPAVPGDALAQLRRQAAVRASQCQLPSRRDEEWRFTDLSELLRVNFQLAGPAEIPAEAAAAFTLPEATHSRLTFVNGTYAPELSDVSALPAGAYGGNWSQLSDTQKSKIVKYLGQQAGAEDAFTALNAAGLADVAVIWAEADVAVAPPLHLLFLSVPGETPVFSQPRVLAVAERGSSLSLVEYYGAVTENCSDIPQDRYYFTNAVTEIWVGENARVTHSRIQRESGDSFHIARSAIAQARDSHYTLNEISLGAKLSRHTLDILQQGEQTGTQLNGLVAIGNEQLADTHSAISLTQPHGTAKQLHKCIVDGSARAVFNGKIFVPQAAQLTDASQLNRNLLLSPKARVNTKPELQITADNVKCTHGATVSQLEADELFYLRSRGLTESEARYLLIDAFAAEILDRLPLPSLRQRLAQCVACRSLD